MKPTIAGFLTFSALAAAVAGAESLELDFETSHGDKLPLIGLGVGNLGHELISDVVREAVDSHKVAFIDTAMASRNDLVIVKGLEASKGSAGTQRMVVQTKVWYTHLGAGRTRLALDQIRAGPLGTSPGVTDLAVLLHWPRCRGDIPWMHCAEEEAALPADVRAAGPPPHLAAAAARDRRGRRQKEEEGEEEEEREEPWVGSWRVLEDAWLAQQAGGGAGGGKLAAIGVSNFDAADLRRLLTLARVKPHVLQGNVWSVVFDPELLALCGAHRIVFQAYDVMHGVVSAEAAARSPRAFAALAALAAELEEERQRRQRDGRRGSARAAAEAGGGRAAVAVSAGSVVLRWLAQQGVGTVPRASSPKHLAANAPRHVAAAVPPLGPPRMAAVAAMARALLTGRGDGAFPEVLGATDHDRDHAEAVGVVATFEHRRPADAEAAAVAVAAAFYVFWVHSETGEEVLAAGPLAAGETASVQTHKGHAFVARPLAALGDQGGSGGGGGGGVRGGPGGRAGADQEPRRHEGLGLLLGPAAHRFEVTAERGAAQHFHLGHTEF